MYLLWKLNSFSVSSRILLTFFQSFIESVLSFSLACWFHSLNLQEKNRLHSIGRVCSKIIGLPTRSLTVVYEQQASKLCGLCFNSYANLKQHLTVSHTIPNKEEFKLLMKYGNARTTAVLDCPVCDKPALVRLDKHLQDGHYINAERGSSVITRAIDWVQGRPGKTLKTPGRPPVTHSGGHYLAQKGYAPTTVKNMMNNVILFIKHVECNFRSASKLKVADFQKLQYEMKTLQSELHKHVVVHRQKVLKKKTQALPGDGDGGQEHCHLMGYLTILTGHRSIVLVNMSCENVFQADSWSGGRKCRILVDDHKTVSSFGHAAVWLNRVEYQWILRLARGKCCPDSLEPHHVFHTPLGRQITKPCNFLYSAWANAGMKGSITFGPIRSSVSTQVKTHLSEKERKQVAQAMCHDPLTAERFYVALPDKNMGYETRNLRLKALKEAAATSISPDDPGDSDDAVSVLSDGSSDGKTEMSLDEEVSPKSLPSYEGGTDDATDDAP
ncbi:uncharacterized protein V6R79_007896 [Siganus canaliculatus]